MFTLAEIQTIAQQTMTYPYKLWGFGEGIALEAVWYAGTALDQLAYRAWVIRMMDRWLNREPRLREEDHSAPGVALLHVYRATQDERYLTRALDLAAQMQQLPSDQSGAWLHRPEHPDYHHYLYVDCMEVDAPFFCQLAAVTGDSQYHDRAAQQLLSYCRLLQDDETGYFHHQYDAEQETVNGIFWGRGNGWAMLGLLKSLRCLPVDHPSYADLLRRFQRLAASIASAQLPSGDWPTVLTEPLAQAEGSLAAMYAYGLLAGIESRLLPDTYSDTITRAFTALRARLLPDGRLSGVSVATPPGTTVAHYDSIAVGESVPWGQGPLLLAALEKTGLLPGEGNLL
jgi:unsaturated rhamnogalacturonyl hydrolase